MTYIMLIAGVGKRLNPLTILQAKCLFKLDDNFTILKRNVDIIKKYDKSANIVFVTGFKHNSFQNFKDITFIYNPFFKITNSIASLWFAKEYLVDDVVIINGDIVTNSKLVKDIVTKKKDRSCVLIDSSISDGDYNVQVNDDKVVVMSKELINYCGEYVGITKISSKDINVFKNKLEDMICYGNYDQWYENVLVQLIFEDNFLLYYIDVKDYEWTEVDCVDDLIKAKKIHKNNSKFSEEENNKES